MFVLLNIYLTTIDIPIYPPYPYTQNKKLSKASVLGMLELMQVNNCNYLNFFFFHTQRKSQSHMVQIDHIWKLIKTLSKQACHLQLK